MILGEREFRDTTGKEYSLPVSNEFIDYYIDNLESKNVRVFLPFAVVAIIIGLVGNACFVFFFGRQSLNVYYTRDALYFRRMAAFDIVICAVVLPYAIVYEAKMITNNVLCKGLELTRHTLIYTSHLLLVSYTSEFTTKDTYVQIKQRLDKNTYKILLFSVIISSPVLFIFEAGSSTEVNIQFKSNASKLDFKGLVIPDEQRRNLSDNSPAWRSYFHPQFCHIRLTFETKEYNYFELFDSMYYLFCGFVFFMSGWAFIARFVKYMEARPLMGQNTLFVRTVVADNPRVSATLERLTSENEEKKELRRQTLARLSVGYDIARFRNGSGVDKGDFLAGEPRDDAELNPRSSEVWYRRKSEKPGQSDQARARFDSTVDDEVIIIRNIGVRKTKSEGSQIKRPRILYPLRVVSAIWNKKPKATQQTNEANIPANSSRPDKIIAAEYTASSQAAANYASSQLSSSEATAETGRTQEAKQSRCRFFIQQAKKLNIFRKCVKQDQAKAVRLDSATQIAASTSTDKKGSYESANFMFIQPMIQSSITGDESVSLVEFLCCCECFKSNRKEIKQLSSRFPFKKHKSFRKTVMWLIVLDMAVCIMAVVTYAAILSWSGPLNVVNLKSVFAFYVVSVLHSELRKSTWGDICNRCPCC